MNPKVISKQQRPEAIIQEKIKIFLEVRGWHVMVTHGNMFQWGFPDLYCMHMRYGSRWVECKNPDHFRFTAAQLESFPKMNAHGVGIWVMVRATEDEYKKLFTPQNWFTYLI